MFVETHKYFILGISSIVRLFAINANNNLCRTSLVLFRSAYNASLVYCAINIVCKFTVLIYVHCRTIDCVEFSSMFTSYYRTFGCVVLHCSELNFTMNALFL